MVVETVGSGEGDLVGISLFCKVVFKALMLTLLGCGGAGLLGINDNFLAETKCQLFTSTTTFLLPLQFKPTGFGKRYCLAMDSCVWYIFLKISFETFAVGGVTTI